VEDSQIRASGDEDFVGAIIEDWYCTVSVCVGDCRKYAGNVVRRSCEDMICEEKLSGGCFNLAEICFWQWIKIKKSLANWFRKSVDICFMAYKLLESVERKLCYDA